MVRLPLLLLRLLACCYCCSNVCRQACFSPPSTAPRARSLTTLSIATHRLVNGLANSVEAVPRLERKLRIGTTTQQTTATTQCATSRSLRLLPHTTPSRCARVTHAWRQAPPARAHDVRVQRLSICNGFIERCVSGGVWHVGLRPASRGSQCPSLAVRERPLGHQRQVHDGAWFGCSQANRLYDGPQATFQFFPLHNEPVLRPDTGSGGARVLQVRLPAVDRGIPARRDEAAMLPSGTGLQKLRQADRL